VNQKRNPTEIYSSTSMDRQRVSTLAAEGNYSSSIAVMAERQASLWKRLLYHAILVNEPYISDFDGPG
jgi:hypothetical protein